MVVGGDVADTSQGWHSAGGGGYRVETLSGLGVAQGIRRAVPDGAAVAAG